MNTKIYLARPTDAICRDVPEFAKWHDNARAVLERYHTVISPYLSDIWVRDFLPIQNPSNGRLFFTKYNPIYDRDKYADDYRAISAQRKTVFPNVSELPMELDGGNLVIHRGCGFAFAKPSEFQDVTPPVAAKILTDALGLVDFVWLPSFDTDTDPFCHLDGFMQFLGDNVLIYNRPDSLTAPHTEKCLDLVREKFPDIKCVDIPMGMPDPESELSAAGIYVNFLATDAAVFYPTYDLPYDDQVCDILSSHTDRPVVAIDCRKISKYGGSLHCLSREII